MPFADLFLQLLFHVWKLKRGALGLGFIYSKAHVFRSVSLLCILELSRLTPIEKAIKNTTII
jgi:hypothetical protein